MSAFFRNMVNLIRPNQWYKNLIVFLAIIFSGNLFNPGLLGITSMGFFVLILISCANYVFNDLVDLKKDRHHPEKKKRPLASASMSKSSAVSLLIIFLLAALVSAYLINIGFFYVVAGIFIISTLYSIFLKNIVLLDLVTISSNFVLRAIAGAIIIDVFISPWLVIGVSFFALFLSTGKRYGEISYLEKKAVRHRKVLAYYSKKALYLFFNILMIVIILIFLAYTFFSEYRLLILTVPLFGYLILRYRHLICSDNKIASNPEKAFKDLQLLIVGVVFVVISLIFILI